MAEIKSDSMVGLVILDLGCSCQATDDPLLQHNITDRLPNQKFSFASGQTRNHNEQTVTFGRSHPLRLVMKLCHNLLLLVLPIVVSWVSLARGIRLHLMD